jgi:hypothetical protein
MIQTRGAKVFKHFQSRQAISVAKSGRLPIEFESSLSPQPQIRIQWKAVFPTGMLAAAGLDYRRRARARLSIMEKQ